MHQEIGLDEQPVPVKQQGRRHPLHRRLDGPVAAGVGECTTNLLSDDFGALVVEREKQLVETAEL
jgi:hypothetical protein